MVEFESAILPGVKQALEIRRTRIGALERGDVLVKIMASGLCHTDLEVIEGSLAYPMPIVLGHEGAGVVEAVGADVTAVRPGDHVVCSWNPHCGHCFYCERDQPILCEPFTFHQPRGHLLDGKSRLTCEAATVHHFSVVSSHAQYSVVPESGAIKVPAEIPFDCACLIGCGVMTGVGAAVRLAQVEAGASVAVIGCGAVGLNVLQGARLANAGRIIAIDRAPGRQNLSRVFSADLTTGEPGDDVVGFVRQHTDGRGADYVFEAAGSADGFRLGAEIVRPGGHLVFLGKVNVNQDVAFRWGALMGEKKITRSSYGGARPRRDFPWLARCYLEGKLKLDELITARLPLARINEGFDAMRRGEGIRTVVLPWHSALTA
jgi:S-(hydroxymethyl)glutathione dehydrogenase/alcohol dehydrogenase